VIPATSPGVGSTFWSRRRLLALLSTIVLVKQARADNPVIEMHQLKFAPDKVEIAAGGAVTFVNLDLVPHTATCTAFDTGTLRKDERKEIAFPVAGEFQYSCKFHHQMTGKVIVR